MEEVAHYGILSLLPPVIAIVLAIFTRQVYVSLLFGIFLGWLIVADWNVFQGFLTTIEALVNVFQDAGNTRTIMFCALVGGLILFIQQSGGVEGFIRYLGKRLERIEARGGSNKVAIQFLAWLTGLLIFVESSISVLTVGTLYRPVFDRLKISREKLAYIADSSSAPSNILIPFNGWGAYIMGLLAVEGFSEPFAILIRTIPYNFYPILALIGVLVVIFFQKDIGPMKKAEQRVQTTGQLLNEGATAMVSDELTDVPTKVGIPPRAYNMVLPILLMVILMPVMLAYTGWAGMVEAEPAGGFLNQLQVAIGKGSGSTSVLVAVITTLLFCIVLYCIQGIFNLKESVEIVLKGIAGLMPLALLMLLAFAIGYVCRYELHTGDYVASVTQAWLKPSLVPFLVFLVSCFIAFSTGTSWGTFAIMIAIAVPMAREMNADIYITIAAALGGGIFGDHCSPISDTTILSSMSSATDHIDHVRTQLPYALIVGGITALIYLIIGLV